MPEFLELRFVFGQLLAHGIHYVTRRAAEERFVGELALAVRDVLISCSHSFS